MASMLSTAFLVITKYLAATEEVLDNEMKDLRRGQLGLEAQVTALESRFLSEIGSLRASCGAG